MCARSCQPRVPPRGEVLDVDHGQAVLPLHTTASPSLSTGGTLTCVSLLSQSLLALCALLHWEMSQLHISLWPKCPALPAMLCFPLPFSRTPFLLSFQTGFISGRCKDNPQLHGLQTPIPGAEQPPNPLRLQGFHPSPRCCSPKGPTPPQQSFWAPSPVPWNEPALAPLEMVCTEKPQIPYQQQ